MFMDYLERIYIQGIRMSSWDQSQTSLSSSERAFGVRHACMQPFERDLSKPVWESALLQNYKFWFHNNHYIFLLNIVSSFVTWNTIILHNCRKHEVSFIAVYFSIHMRFEYILCEFHLLWQTLIWQDIFISQTLPTHMKYISVNF